MSNHHPDYPHSALDETKDNGILHTEEPRKNDVDLAEAIAAENADHATGFLEALSQNKKAVWWSFVVSMCIVMEAYDIALVSNLVALPAFRAQFGHYVDESSGYQVSPPWQSAILQAPLIGAFIGVLISGQTVSRFGYKKTLIVALFFMIGAIFIVFFGSSLGMLLAGQILCGLPWGGFAIIGPAYASEMAPLALRAFLTIYVQLCWCIGQFIAAGVCYAIRNRDDQWAYRIPFAVQWIWPVPLVVLMFFAPESPWWLVRQNRIEEAEMVIKRLGGRASQNPAEVLAYMVRTTEIEAQATAGTSYKDCFKGSDLRRTLITCAIHAFASFSGLLMGNLGTYFFEVAGLDTNMAYALGLGNTGIQFLGVVLSWFFTQHYGRRTLYLWGTGFNFVVLLVIGILSCVSVGVGLSRTLGALVILVAFQCGLTILPMTYVIMGETSSVRLRARTIGLSRDAFYVGNICGGILNSYMINPSAWNLVGKAAFVWAGTALLVWTTCYFHLPEMKGRSWRELDILFHRRTPARKFASTEIDVHEDH